MKKYLLYFLLIIFLSGYIFPAFCEKAEKKNQTSLNDLEKQLMNDPSLKGGEKLVSIKGTVKVKRNKKYIDVKEGMVLKAKDIIFTKNNAGAIIVHADGSLTYLKPNTTLIIYEKNDYEKIYLKLYKGKILNHIQKREPGTFKIITGQAVCGIRGTKFAVSSGKLTSAFDVFEGAVSVYKKNDSKNKIKVQENQSLVIIYNRPATNPNLLNPNAKVNWDRWSKQLIKSSSTIMGLSQISNMVEQIKLRQEITDKVVRDVVQTKLTLKARADLKAIKSAFKKLTTDIKKYPSNKIGIKALFENYSFKGWRGPYLSPNSNLLDPWGNEYKYWLKQSEKSGKYYIQLYSFGPKGLESNYKDWITEIYFNNTIK